MSPLAKWFTIGVLPQLTIWIWYTVVVGGLFGIVAARDRPPPAAPRPEPRSSDARGRGLWRPPPLALDNGMGVTHKHRA